MPDNPESTGAAPEQTGTPKPAASTLPPDSPPSGSPDVDTLVSAILQHPDFQKQTQSVKDKRIAEIQKGLVAQDEEIARLAQVYGTTPEKIAEGNRQLEYDRNMEWIASQRNGTVPETPPQGSAVDLAKVRQTVITQTGLPETHPGLDDFIAGVDWSDPIAAGIEVSTWATEQKAGIPEPSAADTPPASSGGPSSTLAGRDTEEIGKEMIELQRNPRANKARIAELDAELKRRGNL